MGKIIQVKLIKDHYINISITSININLVLLYGKKILRSVNFKILKFNSLQ